MENLKFLVGKVFISMRGYGYIYLCETTDIYAQTEKEAKKKAKEHFRQRLFEVLKNKNNYDDALLEEIKKTKISMRFDCVYLQK